MGISKFSNSNFYGSQKTNTLRVASLAAKTTSLTWVTSAGYLGIIYDVERSLNSKSFQISSNAADYRVKAGSSLPSGMTINSSGVISGIASEVGSDTNYVFTIEALNSSGVLLGERSFNFTIATKQVTQYLTNGSFTYIKPAGPTRLQVLMIGGPGGGGNNRGNGGGGYGGGGGIVFSPAFVSPQAETSYPLVVGYAGGSSCCNNQSGCSGQATTGFSGKAGSGGGGVSEYEGNCNHSPYDPTSVSITGTTTIFNATSGACNFGGNNGAPSITSSITGSSVGYSRGGGSNRGDGSGCATLVSPGLVIVRY